MRKNTKITIIGAGNLGSSIGYEIANRNLVDELIFVDINKDLAIGQADDIKQAIAFKSNCEICAGDYEDASDSDLIVVAAGRPRTAEIKSRLELAEINAKIIKDIATKIREIKFNIIITLTNPMDLMNYLLWKELNDRKNFDRKKIIGSGGQLDSARFRSVLSRLYKVNVTDVEAFVIGEHGDFQVPVFSKVKINGKTKHFSKNEKQKIMEELKNSALNVISKKGATIFAPTNCTCDMIQSILNDEKKLFSCSIVSDYYGVKDVSINVPAILGKNGVEKILVWDLDEDELSMFKKGANELKKYIRNLI